jgi:hypothetical protein
MFRDVTSDVNTAPRDRPSGRKTEAGATINKRNWKWCHYCKILGDGIEKCRKREYNNTRNNHAGNSQSLLSPMDRPRQGSSKIRPVKVMIAWETEEEDAELQ